MLKWAKRIGLILVASLLALLAVGIGFEQWSRYAAQRRFAPPGKLVEVEGIESHLYCTGSGTPTVILESGLDTLGSQGWSSVQPSLAELTRVCSYDRAGLLWSAERGGARDAKAISSELHALLAKAAEPAPYVMVGHSLGGALVRVFAAASEPGAVQGFVLVDASHPEQLKRNTSAERHEPPAALLQVLARIGVLRLIDDGGAPGLPEEAQQRIAAFGPQSMPALIGELRAAEATLEQAGKVGAIGDRPLVVLTAGDKPPAMRELWPILQDELAALSTNSDHRIIADCGHYMQEERPDAVVTAVRDVVIAVRERAQVRRATAEASAIE